ncbi:DUF4304 domain-containing protein [Tabrizicola sp.]|uniref:DUF4304 domain-containing protein n=1 Tax=Tabrizicola sp. TaxID=2005166 RepID=UPI00286C7408|nr:DUF4304 domain-containing protein [Tabrizicola sp.]
MTHEAATEEKYKAVSNLVYASLHENGFAKRGRVFWKDLADVRHLAEFQKSQKSTKDRIFFTMNVSTVVKALLDPEIDDLDKMHGHEGHLYWRLGDFLSPQEDKWWAVDQNSDPYQIAQEISSILSSIVLRKLEQYSTVRAIVDLWSSEGYPPISDKRRKQFLAELANR